MFLMSFTWFSSSQFCPSLFLHLRHVFNLCSPFSLSWLMLCALSASLVRHQQLKVFSLFLQFVWFNWKSQSVFGPPPTQEVTNPVTNGFVLISVWSSVCPGGVWYSKDPTKKKKYWNNESINGERRKVPIGFISRWLLRTIMTFSGELIRPFVLVYQLFGT